MKRLGIKKIVYIDEKGDIVHDIVCDTSTMYERVEKAAPYKKLINALRNHGMSKQPSVRTIQATVQIRCSVFRIYNKEIPLKRK